MFRTYLYMKDSGMEWVREVPERWSLMPLKRLSDIQLSNVDKHYLEGQQEVRLCNYVDVYKNNRIVPNMSFMVSTATSEQIRRLGLQSGDVIITKDSETPDDIGIPAFVPQDLPGVVCGYHLALIRPRLSIADGGFLFWAIQSCLVSSQFSASAEGITRYALGKYEIGKTVIVTAPVEEQHAIASYLDRKTTLIDDLIAKRKRQIELLQEHRTAIISRAITKGLDPNVSMKNSGVEAIGLIPLHWQTSPLMHLTPPTRQIMYGIVLPGPHVEGGIPIVKSGDCNPEKLRLDRLNRTTPEIEAPYARARLEPGDIVYAIRGSIGASAMVPDELRGANLTQDAARIAPAKNVNPHWLWFAVQAGSTWTQLKSGIVGATVKGVNICDLKRPYIPIPPVEEQVVIAKYLMEKIESMRDLIEKTLKTIEKLKEYRQSLISAAVTGKIDVRNWQPSFEPAEESLHA